VQPVGLLHTLSGFSVGALVGMTGVSGGSLMTPLLILNFGIHPAAAHCVAWFARQALE
jgi:uncharacterized protein